MRFLALFAQLFLIAGLLSTTHADLPPGVVNTQPNGDRPLSPAASLAKITVPNGFQVTLFAGEPDVYQPIAMEFDDRGRLWVVENFSYPDWQSKDRDRILIFEDKDNDGRFDDRKVFAENLSNITGIALGYGGVWCCSTPNFIFIPDRDGDDIPDGPAQIKLDGWNDDSGEVEHNVFNGMTWGPDGWMYGSHGILADSLVGKPGTPDAKRQRLNCGIWRYHPVTEEFEIVAHGTTNPWGIDFDETGEGFFTNCVIGHLWHLIPGAHYERMYGKHFNPYAYTLIDACSDHLHWGGGNWTDSRGGKGVHSIAGGGHAHVGTMIYLGGSWPAEYHGSLFTCNLHGNRINRDVFERHGSGYTAKHAPDFLMANDPWFRGIAIKYGPDGNVFVSDWTDLGECHDSDGTHRSSGRIYKISYVGSGTEESVNRDLAKLPSKELFELLLNHNNAWHRRHALRLLQERNYPEGDLPEGFDTAKVHAAAKKIASDRRESKLRRLRALWATGGDLNGLDPLLDDPDPHVQAWYLRLRGNRSLLTDVGGNRSSNPSLANLIAKAKAPQTPLNVKLEIASLLRNGSLATSPFQEQAWQLAAAMLEGLPEHEDPNLTQMVWYAIEPMYSLSPNKFVRLALQGDSDERMRGAALKLSELIVRKTMSSNKQTGTAIELITDNATETKNSAARLALLQGLRRALVGRKQTKSPEQWGTLYTRLLQDGQKNEAAIHVADELAVKFRDSSAIARLRSRAQNSSAPISERERAMRLLVENLGIVESRLPLPQIGKTEPRLLPSIFQLLGSSPSSKFEGYLKDSLASLASTGAKSNARQSLDQKTSNALVGALVTTPNRVKWLLDAIEAKIVPSKVILPVHALQIERLEDREINTRLRKVWGVARKSSKEKLAKIREWKRILTDDFLSTADVAHGRKLFHENCGKCHKLFGQGDTIGPDLTGSDRRNLDYFLQNVIDPSALVGKDYRLQSLFLESGLVATGVIVEESPTAITLQKVDSRETYPRDEIEAINSTRLSLMPEGQLDRMSRKDARDLVAYLRLDRDLGSFEQ